MKLNQLQLKKIANECASKIIDAEVEKNYFIHPYKHLIIDNFLPDSLAQSCLENFPELNSKNFEHANDRDIEIKFRTKWESEFDIPDGIIDAVRILNSSMILNAMAKLFEIKKIIPDPYFTGGGLNITDRGGLLDVHVDGNYHDATGLNRRFNSIIYLNKGWQENWGGEFCLYDSHGNECLKKVAPIFNRLIIFNTHDKSFHGLPEPINFPENKNRKSIILYYYTKEGRSPEEVTVRNPHSALWKKRGLNDKKGNKTRDFD